MNINHYNRHTTGLTMTGPVIGTAQLLHASSNLVR